MVIIDSIFFYIYLYWPFKTCDHKTTTLFQKLVNNYRFNYCRHQSVADHPAIYHLFNIRQREYQPRAVYLYYSTGVPDFRTITDPDRHVPWEKKDREHRGILNPNYPGCTRFTQYLQKPILCQLRHLFTTCVLREKPVKNVIGRKSFMHELSGQINIFLPIHWTVNGI